jgi:hypothetical protein
MITAQRQVVAQRQAGTRPTLASERLVLSAIVEGDEDEASRDRIRRLFYSPLGVYVSQASREHDSLRVEFDVAATDLDFTIRTLRSVLPEAAIETIRARVFTHKH